METLTHYQVNDRESPFEQIKRIDDNGAEYWMGTELQGISGYSKKQDFFKAIIRAELSCKNTGNPSNSNFLWTSVITEGRSVKEVKLSRYACYLVFMNGDPSKLAIAQAQSYFAAKTREAELAHQKQIPQTYIEALKALVESEEEKERLKAQRELDRAMISVLEEESDRQSEVIDELFNYSSIIRVAKFNGIGEKSFHWRMLKTASKIAKTEVKKAPCPRFGTKNLYSHEAWQIAYPAIALPENNQIKSL
jgi:hypothetical protein